MSVDSSVEIQWHNQFLQSLEEGAGKPCLECVLSMVRGDIFYSVSKVYLTKIKFIHLTKAVSQQL